MAFRKKGRYIIGSVLLCVVVSGFIPIAWRQLHKNLCLPLYRRQWFAPEDASIPYDIYMSRSPENLNPYSESHGSDRVVSFLSLRWYDQAESLSVSSGTTQLGVHYDSEGEKGISYQSMREGHGRLYVYLAPSHNRLLLSVISEPSSGSTIALSDYLAQPFPILEAYADAFPVLQEDRFFPLVKTLSEFKVPWRTSPEIGWDFPIEEKRAIVMGCCDIDLSRSDQAMYLRRAEHLHRLFARIETGSK